MGELLSPQAGGSVELHSPGRLHRFSIAKKTRLERMKKMLKLVHLQRGLPKSCDPIGLPEEGVQSTERGELSVSLLLIIDRPLHPK